MLTSFAVPAVYQSVVEQFNDFEVTALHTDNPPPITTKPLFLWYNEELGIATPTKVLKYAKKLKATGLILSAQEVPHYVDKNDIGNYKLVVVPHGATYDDFWKDLDGMTTINVNRHPSFLAWGVDSMVTSFALYAKHLLVPDAYGSRPSVVQRMVRQSSTKDNAIMLLGGGTKGGRELAEYKFLRNVQYVYTPDAWLIAKAGYQLGIPSRGRPSLPSMDYDIDRVFPLAGTAVDKDVKDVLVPNIQMLKGLC